MKFIEHLKTRLESFLNQANSIQENCHVITNLINQIRTEANRQIELRTDNYRGKFPSILEELCILTAKEKHLQLIDKQHYHSKQFFKKIFNIQSLIDIGQYHQQYEQSIQCLNELKSTVQQQEIDLHRMKEKIIEQNNEMHRYANELFQIQFEQNEIRSNIEQLKEQILFEKRLHSEIKSTLQTLPINETSALQIDLLQQLHTEYLELSTQITQMKFYIEQKSIDLLPLQFELYIYRTILNVNDIYSMKCTDQPFLLPTMSTNTERIPPQSATIVNQLTDDLVQVDLQQLPIEIQCKSQYIKIKSRKIGVPTTNNEQSLGPNLQSRLEALEAAMGVRLNVAKRQGRHSLSGATSPSPMQVSPTSTANSTSLSTSSRQNIPTRSGQGVQRSASSCDVENRPGPIKRLKPSLPNENSSPSSTSTATAIATVKRYPPPVRRPLLTTNQTPTRPKQPTPIKQRSSPMDTSSPRLSRSSTSSNNSSSNSSNYRTPIGGISPKICNSPSPKERRASSPPRPPPSDARKHRLSIFGEQFSADILRTNLLWLDYQELDEEGRSEVILQFGSIENFLREQNFFVTKQQQQLKLAAKHKTLVNRSRFQFFIPKKDRLELL